MPLGEGGTTVDEPDEVVLLVVLLNGSDEDDFLRGLSGTGSLMAVTSLFASDREERFAAVDDRGSPSPRPKFPASASWSILDSRRWEGLGGTRRGEGGTLERGVAVTDEEPDTLRVEGVKNPRDGWGLF